MPRWPVARSTPSSLGHRLTSAKCSEACSAQSHQSTVHVHLRANVYHEHVHVYAHMCERMHFVNGPPFAAIATI